MQILISIMFCSVVLVALLIRSGLPSIAILIPEAVSAIAAVCVIVMGARQGFRLIPARYWIAFALLSLFILCGIIVNDVDAGPIIAGLRNYLRVIPFFLLPAVARMSEKQMKGQLGLLAGLCLLQLPTTVSQRMTVMSQARYTGDLVWGTLATSGHLSIFLISAACVLVGLTVRRGLLRPAPLLLLLGLLIPTMINETKVSFFLVPLGLLTAALVGTTPGRRLRMVGTAAALIVGFGSIFIPVYNAMQAGNPYPQTISLDLLTDNKKNYLEQRDAGVGARTYVGRADAVTIPLSYLAQDPMRLAFGLGIGNANTSSLGASFSGRYGSLFEFVTTTSFAFFLLEFGIPGTLLILLLHWFIFRDAVALARSRDGLLSGIAVGWVGVSVVIGIAIFYVTTQAEPTISYLFWYFSGIVVAGRAQLESKTPKESAPALT